MIERCFDLRRVKRLADWDLCISRRLIYLVEVEDGEDVGVIVFVPTPGGFMTHVELGKKCRGTRAAQIVRDCFKWVFTHTDAETIFADIPVPFRRVHFMARHVGMRFDGIDADVLRCYSLTKQAFTDMRGVP